MHAVSTDYILRMVQQFVAALVQLITQQQLPQAEELVQQSALRLLGFDLALLERMSVDHQVLLLASPERLEAAAELLAGRAAIILASGDGGYASSLRRNAVALLERAKQAGHGEPARLAERQRAILGDGLTG